MKNTDIESFLRENKPQVKDNPTFLLEAQHKMRAVDGIRSEVVRQRSYGRLTLVLALFVGLASGMLVAALVYMYPIDTEIVNGNILADIKLALEPWKKYILLFVAGCSVMLGVVFSTKRTDSMGLL